MSGSAELTIVTGSDWGVEISWTDGSGIPITYSNPVMNIRQELSPTGTLLAELDQSGTKDGTIVITNPGVMQLNMDHAITKGLRTGRGFWDIFVNVNGARTRLLFGTINITPHVTVDA